MDNILNRIDELRKERGWSVNTLAMEAMLTQSTVNNLYGRGSEPKLSTLRAICGAFGMTLAEFFSPIDESDEDSELISRVKRLSPDKKSALLTLLRSIK